MIFGSKPCVRRAPAASTSTRRIRDPHHPHSDRHRGDDAGQPFAAQERASAMNILRSRIYDAEQQRINATRAADRREKVGSGDRSERIRTYNFPQGRVTDSSHQPHAL